MERHRYYFASGFTISGTERILYEHNEAIQFNEASINALGFPITTTWNFYNSITGGLIKTVSGGSSASTSFTYAEGTSGIDVELIIEFSIHKIIYKKRRRLVIGPDKSTANYTYTLNQVAALYANGNPITGGATADVTNGSPNISTSAAHGVSVDDVVAFKQGGIYYIYRAIAGTAGSTIVIDKNFEGATGTIANADARYGSISPMIDGASWGFGKIIHLTGTVYCDRFMMKNISGASIAPNIITVPDGDSQVIINKKTVSANDDCLTLYDNQEHAYFYFDKDSSGNRKFIMNGGGLSLNHFTTGNVYSEDNLRFTGMEANNVTSSGFKLKTDSNDRATGGLDDCYFFDNYLDGAGNEGVYFGYFTYGYVTTKYYAAHKRLKLWGNTMINTQWDGIQVACADEETEVHDNFCESNGLSDTTGQNFAYSINEGFKGHFYNNIAEGAAQFHSYGTTYVYNNYIGGLNKGNSIFLRRADNPMLGVPSYVTFDPNADFYLFNNTLICENDALYALDANDDGTGAIPIRNIYYFNNSVFWTGAPVSTGEFRDGTGATMLIKDNYIPTSLTELALIDKANLDVNLSSASGVFASANEGLDATLYIDETILPLGLMTDITGRVIPDRGYWRPSHVHRYEGFDGDVFSPNKTAIQWYVTNQIAGFTDKEILPDYFGYIVKTTEKIINSAKPKLIASVKPYAQTGNVVGAQVLDNESA